MRSWEDLRRKLALDDNKNFYWRQIIHVIPCAWKEICLECGNNISDLIINEHQLIKKHQIYCLEKLNIRKLYHIQLIIKVEKPTAQTYFEKKFQNPELEWKDIYISHLDMQRLIQIFAYFSIIYYVILYILTKCFTNLEKKGIPTLLFLHGRT